MKVLILIFTGLLLGSTSAAEIGPKVPVKLSEPLLFSFAQMCDTQLGMGGYEHDVKTFGLAVTQINKLKPDFVVICGDLVSKANDKSWADLFTICLQRLRSRLVADIVIARRTVTRDFKSCLDTIEIGP